MIVGRRRSIAASLFFALAFLATAGGQGRAQSPHPVNFDGETLTTDQLKQALLRLQGPSSKESESFLKEIQKTLAQNPQLQQEFKDISSDPARRAELAKKMQASGLGNYSTDQLQELLKKFQPAPGLGQQSGLPAPKNPTAREAPPARPQSSPGTDTGKVDDLWKSLKGLIPQGGKDAKKGPIETPLNELKRQSPELDRADPPPPSTQNLFGNPSPVDPGTRTAQTIAAFWERNIGPLKDSPDVEKTLFDLFSSDSGPNLDFKDENGNSIWDQLKNVGGGSDGADWSNLLNGSDWKGPDFDLPSFNPGRWFGDSSSSSRGSGRRLHSTPRLEAPSAGGGLGGLSGFGGGPSWLPVVLLGAILLAVLGIWWFVRGATAAGGVGMGFHLGPWPINPKAIASREDVVKAFEYLSVLICGPAAKMWTHGTIAEALTQLAVSHEEQAMKLARLYELARYAPLTEPLSNNEVIEARVLVCDLAGVS